MGWWPGSRPHLLVSRGVEDRVAAGHRLRERSSVTDVDSDETLDIASATFEPPARRSLVADKKPRLVAR